MDHVAHFDLTDPEVAAIVGSNSKATPELRMQLFDIHPMTSEHASKVFEGMLHHYSAENTTAAFASRFLGETLAARASGKSSYCSRSMISDVENTLGVLLFCAVMISSWSHLMAHAFKAGNAQFCSRSSSISLRLSSSGSEWRISSA